MNIENICNIVDALLMMFMFWVVYVHIYGIEVSVYRKNMTDRAEKHSLIYKITHIKYSLWLIILSVCFIGGFLGKEQEDLKALIDLCLLQAFCFCVAKERKLRSSFWVWPVIFTAYIPNAILETAWRAIGVTIDLERPVNSLLFDFLLMPLYLFILFLDRKYKFSKRVRKKEKFLVLLISVFISIICILFFLDDPMVVPVDGNDLEDRVAFLALAIFLLVMVIRMIAVGTSADYYEELSAIYEKNARETLAFYESYKDAQLETRKLRHDMKNHLACIQMLTKEEKYKELQEYLENFNEAVSEVSLEIQTGNDIVDAILNVKVSAAKKEGIAFSVAGMLPLMPFVDAMDWCKMISNAVDNGIEALRNCSIEEKVLKIQFRDNGNFLVIHVENACEEKVQINGTGIRTKKQDKVHHGFGIKNIEAAVKKYGGELQLSCEQRGEKYCFCLDMLLPLNRTASN